MKIKKKVKKKEQQNIKEADKTYTVTVRCISKDGNDYVSDYDRNGKNVTISE